MMLDQKKQMDLEKLFQDEAFAKEVLTMQDLGDVQAALKAKGVDLSIAEIEGLGKDIKKALAKQQEQEDPNAELSLEDLEDVAGGFFGTAIFVATCLVAIAAGAGAAVFLW